MKTEHNVILEDGKILPIIIEFNEKLTNKEIEGLKISASNGINILNSTGHLTKSEDNLLLETKKEIILDKIKEEDIEKIDLSKLKRKIVNYKIFSKE